MTGGEDESVPIRPIGIVWVVTHDLGVQGIAGGRRAKRRPRMSGVCLLHPVDRKRSNCINHQLLELIINPALSTGRCRHLLSPFADAS